jgi:hypothetical protein
MAEVKDLSDIQQGTFVLSEAIFDPKEFFE